MNEPRDAEDLVVVPTTPGDAAAPVSAAVAAAPEPAAVAADLREVLRPLWRRLNAHRTLSPGKIGILFRLEQRGALAAADLAGLEQISHQAVATAVRELEELDLVSRSPDPADGRRTLVSITQPGRARLRDEQAAGQDWLARAVTERLGPDDRATLATAIPLLRRLDVEETR